MKLNGSNWSGEGHVITMTDGVRVTLRTAVNSDNEREAAAVLIEKHVREFEAAPDLADALEAMIQVVRLGSVAKSVALDMARAALKRAGR
jgi:hypothetical protein